MSPIHSPIWFEFFASLISLRTVPTHLKVHFLMVSGAILHYFTCKVLPFVITVWFDRVGILGCLHIFYLGSIQSHCNCDVRVPWVWEGSFKFSSTELLYFSILGTCKRKKLTLMGLQSTNPSKLGGHMYTCRLTSVTSLDILV